MTQNLYDNDGFFAGYSKLGRSVDGLDGAAEWPTIRALLPEMAGLRVLDLGCGFGWFCRGARAAGSGPVTGVDVSEKMLERARADTQDSGVGEDFYTDPRPAVGAGELRARRRHELQLRRELCRRR